MTVRLRFAVDIAFDSRETAKAYAVALGFRLGQIEAAALELSEAPNPALSRSRIDVTEIGNA